MPRDDQGAQAVDAVLQDHRARRDDAAHQAHGEALAHQFLHQAPVIGEVFPPGDQDLGLFQDIEDAENHRHRLRDDGGHRCARHPHIEPGDKEDVQAHVQAGGKDQKDQRHHAVADGPQQGRAEVIGEHHQHKEGDDRDIAVSILQNFGGGVQQHQQGMEEEHSHRGNNQGGHNADDHGPGHRLADPLVILGAEGPGGDDGQAVADSQAEAH